MHKSALLFAVLAIFLAVHATDPNQPPERPDYDPHNVTMSHFLTWMKEWLPHARMLPAIYRTIKSHQMTHRYQVWKQTVKAVWEQNHKVDELWTAGLNMFSHLTDDEFKNIDWGLRLPEDFNMTYPINTPQPEDPEMQKRAGKEWKGTSKVKAVRNQGQCGSCWAFAAAGALEGGLSTDVNPQEILDCSGAGSCNGGFPDRGIGYGSKGVTPFGSYNGGSYKAAQGQCAARSSRKCTGQVQSANSDAGLVRLLNNGPVSVNINADGLKNYKSGVANAACSNSINHAVLATGYSGSAYMVKNSWGTSWGSGGYFQFAQNKNQCGISSMCYQPTGCK